ncbi:AAA family ATPase [Candidatus Saccharibacteria bacterium]|nr:AAA family ATPase [Candidatus Saccharibacteria bacterium]MCB9821528.1 AAA family ATPase [Candidatus Nomurabacteria bacterium]
MKSYALHDTVHELLSSFAGKPNGNLLIVGVKGSGLSMAIDYVVHSIYAGKERPGEIIRMSEFTVEASRQLLKQLSVTRANTQKPRLVVIDDAHKLNIEAQNTLLKTIEEPPKSTHFILATSDMSRILPTIASRCFIVKLKRPAIDDLRTVFASYSDSDFNQSLHMADGWPGTMRNILENTDSPIVVQINQAKDFMSKNIETRIAETMKIDREGIQALLEGMLRICNAYMRIYAANDKKTELSKWQARTRVLNTLDKQVESGLNPKLAALSMSLNI